MRYQEEKHVSESRVRHVNGNGRKQREEQVAPLVGVELHAELRSSKEARSAKACKVSLLFLPRGIPGR